MKRIMKRYGKTLAALALSLLLLASLVLPAAAKSGETDEEPIVFEVLPDGTLTDGDRSFAPYELPIGCKLDCTQRYVFNTGNEGLYDDDFFVAATRDGDIVWPFFRDDPTVYVTVGSRARIEALANGDGSERRMVYKQTYLSAEKTEALLARILPGEGSAATDVNVTELRGTGYYEIRSYEASGTVYAIDALIFCLEDRYAYLDLTALDNTHFDADGNFSYRSGTVPLCFLGDEAAADLEFTFNSAAIRQDVIRWQSDGSSGNTSGESPFSLVFFWITAVLFGFILPGAGIILGVVLTLTGQKKKRWSSLSACALVWLLAAIGCLCILL